MKFNISYFETQKRELSKEEIELHLIAFTQRMMVKWVINTKKQKEICEETDSTSTHETVEDGHLQKSSIPMKEKRFDVYEKKKDNK